ncbi:hypothetical protein [Pseudomonas sp. Hp2]|uniref:hypothetical protein n=1 Tax=Pseudomonas sp. Hp2 TaxID=701189 RepID=UPI0011277DE4|nr:hypothetical protein [Pseudomonas sp. Hp2]
MKLNEFVKETLVQIARGVHDAQQDVRALGGMVNPATLSASQSSGSYFASVDSMHHVFLVDFDVAVEVSETTGTNAEAGLSVATFAKLGAGGKSSNANSTSNRIAFKVPLALPIDKDSQTKLQGEIDRTNAALRNHGSQW